MSVTLHSSLGDIKIEVFCDTAQRTAFNFLALCASGYYDGTSFHRNMKGFMVQGGDPTGTGKGGESIWGGKFQVSEVLSSDIRATQSWSTVSYVFIGTTGRIPCWQCARQEGRREHGQYGDEHERISSKNIFYFSTRQWRVPAQSLSVTSWTCDQFFITYERQPHLNNVYTVLGKVLDGWDVLDQIERLPVEGAATQKKRNKHRPINPPVISHVTIHANPLADDNIIYPTKDGPSQQ